MRTPVFLDSFRFESQDSILVRLWAEDKGKPAVETVTLHSASVAGLVPEKTRGALTYLTRDFPIRCWRDK